MQSWFAHDLRVVIITSCGAASLVFLDFDNDALSLW